MDRQTTRFIVCSIVSLVAMAAADSGVTADTIIVNNSTLSDSSVVNIIEDTSGTGVALAAATMSSRARVLLVDGRFNIESIEADIAEGDYDESDEKPSLILGNDSPKGLGFIIPGAVFTTIGVNLMFFLLDERSSSTIPEQFDSPIVVGSLLTIWSVASFTIGIHQLRRHVRIGKRYAMPERKRNGLSATREIAPVVIRKTQR